MKKVIVDLECDGLFDTVQNIWVAVTKDLGTNKINTFSDFDKNSKPLNDLTTYLDTADVLIAHNGIAYDFPVLKKLLNWEPKDNVKVIDTMLVSQLCNFRREGKHSLRNFGEILGFSKIEFDDFSKYSDEMKTYCIQDVELNHKVYEMLLIEAKTLTELRPNFKNALQLEHAIARICASQMHHKWKFNVQLAKKHYDYLINEMNKIETEIKPSLKPREVFKDKESKFPKYTRDGNYTTVTARMLSELLGKEVKITDTHVWESDKPFKRKEIIPADLGNTEQVKLLLLDSGWQPTQFTPKGDPKITEESLQSVQGDLGKKVLSFYSMRSRSSVLKGLIELAEANGGRVYMDVFNIGTPSFRQRTSKVVNIPSVNAFFGKQMRELFIADEGMVIVGCDSSGNQMRALAHYLNNEKLNDHILNGDIHQANADAIGIDRQTAKSVLYATMFGAGNAKIGKTITGEDNMEVGKKAREALNKVLVGLKELTKRLNDFFYSTEHKDGVGWLPTMDGRRLYPETSFKSLNYLLQSFEAITVKSAVVQAHKMFKEKNIFVQHLALVHDEQQLQCKKEDAEEVKKILEYCFGEYITKELKLNIPMAGDAKIGNNWAETH